MDFTEAWRTVCLNQFHDIIPGSSITPVYEESQAQYASLQETVTTLRDQALKSITDKLGADLLLVNPTSFRCAEPVFIPGGLPEGLRPVREGKPLATQAVDGGCLVAGGELPPYSLTPLSLAFVDEKQSDEITIPRNGELPILENELIRVEFNAAGDIMRIYDKLAKREVLSNGATGNQFQAFEDRPRDFDAWEIDIFYDDKCYLPDPANSIELVENGPLRQTIEVKRRILTSPYTQRISLWQDSQRLDFNTFIDWKERSTMLKVAFPVEVFSPQATYEIQWGNVQRPTHRNTSWDWARFESCAQKWADLSEGDYGVSLLNDCKYGHDIRDNVIRLTLLRGPTMPDPGADYGEHHFTYSLFPHNGGWDERTQAAAYALNDPPLAWLSPAAEIDRQRGKKKLSPQILSFVTVSKPNVIIETIKAAEDGQEVILRLYESQRKRCRVELVFSQHVESAWLVNLLEEDPTPLKVNQGRVEMELKPYQIASLRLRFT